MAYGYVTWYKETNGNEPEQGSLHSEYYWKQNVPLTPHNRSKCRVFTHISNLLIYIEFNKGYAELPFLINYNDLE